MPQLVTITFRITKQREDQIRKELELDSKHRLSHIMIYYTIRDTVCAWLDGGQEADLRDVPDLDDDADGLEKNRATVVSDRPYKTKRSLKIRRKNT